MNPAQPPTGLSKRLKYLIYLCIFISLASPAQARITLGLTSGANSMTRSEVLAGRFASYLESRLGEPVKLRLFADETILHQWLNRYREVDVAILSYGYFRQQRDGEFLHLADPMPGKGLGPVVSRQGAAPLLNQRIRDILLVMDSDPAAEDILKKMGIRRFIQPGRRTLSTENGERRGNSLPPRHADPLPPGKGLGKGGGQTSGLRPKGLTS